MYALASLWRPLGSAPLCFYLAWQVRDLLSGVPWAPRLCVSIWRGRRRASVFLFGVVGAGLAALQGA